MKLPTVFNRKRTDLAPVTTRERVIIREIGGTGTPQINGWLTSQDYNVDLHTPAAYDIYDRMRRADGQVKSALNVIKLPLLSADWEFAPASNDAIDVEIANTLNDQLLEGMSASWQTTLRQILLHLDFGSMPFETVWELKNSLIQLRKLAPRMPKTITHWHLDEKGGLSGITQSTFVMGNYDTVQIPVEKLLVFVNELEGSDYKGVSVLRAAYKHWYFKDKMYIIDAIAKERRAIGVDVGTLSEDADNSDQGLLETALMGLHAHEKQFFIEQEGSYKYRIEGLNGRPMGAMDSIEHHDLRILRSVLAEFLAMGSGSTGSLAMHNDKSAFFLMALRGVASNVTDTINRHLVPRWVDFNWSGYSRYPKLTHSKLETRPVSDIADAVNKLMSVGALTPSREIEESMRGVLELPDMVSEEPLDDDIDSPLREIANRQATKMHEVYVSGRKRFEEITVPYKKEVVEVLSHKLDADKARFVANVLGDWLKYRLIDTGEKPFVTPVEIRRMVNNA